MLLKIINILTSIMLIVFIIVFYSCQRSNNDDLQKFRTIHNEQITTINDIIKVEREEHNKNIEKLNNDLNNLQNAYDKAIKELENKKQLAITNSIKTFNEEPDKMLTELIKAYPTLVKRWKIYLFPFS